MHQKILMLEVQPETLHFETSSWVMLRLQLCPIELSAVMECSVSALSNTLASTHLSLLSTEELNFEVHLPLINLNLKSHMWACGYCMRQCSSQWSPSQGLGPFLI